MIYELRSYRIPEGKMPNILARFKDITMSIFERHGKNEMPAKSSTSANTKTKRLWKMHWLHFAQIPNGKKREKQPKLMVPLCPMSFQK